MKVGSENTCGHEGYAKKARMAKLSKAKIKAKARMTRNLRNLFGTYPFDYTPHYTRHR